MAVNVKYLAVTVAAMLLFATPTALDSCAIGDPEPLFMTQSGPANARGEFFRGRIGVIVPTFNRSYLIAAYRFLSGRTFSSEEVDAFFIQEPIPPNDGYLMGPYAWQQARSAFPPAPPIPADVYKSKTGTDYLNTYRNCLDDAFVTASRTLRERASRWGADSPNLREWLAAQDQVFQNCSGKVRAIPADPPPGIDPLLAADREYQIAAAHFYSGDWEEARKRFQRVAEHADSPWQEITPYLIARVYLREGMIDEKRAALDEAGRRFAAIVSDPAQEEWQDASASLLDFTEFRIHSFDRLAQYGAELSGERPAEDLHADLRDFAFLFDRAEDKSKLAATSDLADWLMAFEGRTLDARAHVLDRWRKSHNRAWLIAALRWASGDELPELIQAAREVKPDDPAYESAVYYGIVAEAKRGHRDEAREWADQALNGNLQLSSRNRILAERLKLARNWNEFLRFAPRQTEPSLALYDYHEVDLAGEWTKAGELFDTDATKALNRHVPLLLFADASRNPRLPKHLQATIAQSGLVRSLVLGRPSLMRDFMKRLIELNPEITNIAQEILSAPDAQQAHFAGIMLILRTSGTIGFIMPAQWKPTELRRAKRTGSIHWGFHPGWLEALTGSDRNGPVDLGFLSPVQRAQGEFEFKVLQERAGCGATYAENEAIQWALKHPDDARVPEALHLAVQATFRGCREADDGRVGKLSRQAFQLLHQRYPDSEWTKKTKYWYR